MSKDARQILIDARELISDKHAWAQDEYRGLPLAGYGSTRYCALGAIYEASKYDPDLSDSAIKALGDTITGWGYPSKSSKVMYFNDRWYRRHKTVLRKFDKAIKNLGGRDV